MDLAEVGPRGRGLVTTESAYADAGFVWASHYRVDVLHRLADRPATPSTIAEDTTMDIARASRALSELRERELVDLKVPEERKKGRIYGLTDSGRECLDALDRMGVEA